MSDPDQGEKMSQKSSIMPQSPVGAPGAPDANTYPSFKEGLAAVDAFMGKVSAPEASSTLNQAVPTKESQKDTLNQKISDLDTAIESAEETPELTLEKVLKSYDLSRSDAEEIVDCLMQGKEYQKKYELNKRFSVVFRSRLLRHQNQTLDALEAYNPVLPMTTGSLIAQHNLAQSIVSVAYLSTDGKAGNNTVFSESNLKERLEWVANLDATVGRLVTEKLAKFDNMLLDLMSEGIISNF